MNQKYIGLNNSLFYFNRFQNETYLYDRREQEYVVLTGEITDLLHLTYLENVTLKDLEVRINQILATQKIDPVNLKSIVDEMLRLDILTIYDNPKRANVISNEISVVDHIRNTRNSPYFYSPLAANLFINGKCNQKCGFCFLDFELMKQEHSHSLTEEQWLRITDELIESGVTLINIGGMEPLISFDLALAILERAHSAGVVVGMITNGTIPLAENQLKRLANIKCKVGISLQNHVDAVHNKMAELPRAFQQCVSNVKNMIAYGVPVGIQSVALRENTRNIEDFIKWIDELGADSFNIQNVFGGPWCSQTDFWNVVMRPSEFQTVINRINDMKDKVNINIEMDLFPHQRPSDHYKGDHKGMKFRAFSTCSAGKTAIQISPSGDVSPCPFTVGRSENAIGNLMDQHMLDIWHNTPAFGPFRKWLKEDYNSPACKSCEAFDICRGGCLITAKWANNGYLNGDPRCSKVSEVLQMG